MLTDTVAPQRAHRDAKTQHLYVVHPTNLQLFLRVCGAKIELLYLYEGYLSAALVLAHDHELSLVT